MRRIRRDQLKLRKRVERLQSLVEKGVANPVEFVSASGNIPGASDNDSQLAFTSDSDFSEAETICDCNSDCDPGLSNTFTVGSFSTLLFILSFKI